MLILPAITGTGPAAVAIGGDVVANSISITAPTNRLVGQTYTAVVDPAGAPKQWQIDGADVSGETGTTFAPATPGRVTARSGALVSDPVWARLGPTGASLIGFTGGAAFSDTFDLGADYPHKKAYAIVMGFRSGGSASFDLSFNGSSSHRVAPSIWDETTRFGHVYAIDNPGTSLAVSYAGTDLQFIVVMAVSAAGFASDATTDFGFDSVSASNSTGASVSITNGAHGLVLGFSESYQNFPQGPALLSAASTFHLLGEVLTSANTERAITATRTGSAAGKRFAVASFAPLADAI